MGYEKYQEEDKYGALAADVHKAVLAGCKGCKKHDPNHCAAKAAKSVVKKRTEISKDLKKFKELDGFPIKKDIVAEAAILSQHELDCARNRQ